MKQRHVDKISIAGFRSIRELRDLPLKQNNVLIGANGAGKSNFIEVFKLLNAVMYGGLQAYVQKYGEPKGFLFNGPKVTSEIMFELSFGTNSYKCSLKPDADRKLHITDAITNNPGADQDNKTGTEQISGGILESNLSSFRVNPSDTSKQVYDAISSWKIYHFHDTDLRAPLRQDWEVKDSRQLYGDGRNLAPFIMRLRDEHPQIYKSLIAALKAAIPGFGDFLFEATNYGNGARMVDLAWRHKHSGFPMQHYHLSDGSLRFIALIACFLHPEPRTPATIIIDEPELGLHPGTIEIMAEYLKHDAQQYQTIVATQSPVLLDQFSQEEIITVNTEDGESKFKWLAKEDLYLWDKKYSLGDLWRMNVISASRYLLSLLSVMIRVNAIVEGRTEKMFVEDVIRPKLQERNINIYCTEIRDDINFDRVRNYVLVGLKRAPSAYVTTMLDYYGIDSDWPGVNDINSKLSQGTKIKSTDIQAELGKSFKESIRVKLAADVKDPHPFIERLIPYFQIYEFEALFFGDIESLANYIGCDPNVIAEHIGGVEPEEINDKRETSPKRRLMEIYQKHKMSYKKIADRQILASEMNLNIIREKCPNFNAWLSSLETLAVKR